MIAVVGAGVLGTRLASALAEAELVRVDVTDRAAVRAMLETRRYRAVINAAGKTGRPNVDWCESHREPTYAANTLGPLVLAEACARAGAYLLHLGSGCVFYGPSPHEGGWREEDHANPVGYYSKTKYAADLALAGLPDVAVVRVRMSIDGAPGPRNLITRLASYAFVADVESSVTVVDDLIDVVRGLVTRRAAGVFHATNPGTLRHRDLLALYRDVVAPDHAFTMIPEDELLERGLVAVRRSSCVLASWRLGELGIAMRPIEVAVRSAMQAYARACAPAPRATSAKNAT